MMKFSYEQPTLKKYGTMKLITKNGSLSGSLGGNPATGGGKPDPSPEPSKRRGDDSKNAFV